MKGSIGGENGGISKQSPKKQSPASGVAGGAIHSIFPSSSNKNGDHSGMKVTYFQNTFSKQQLRPYTLRFRNKELEKEYEGELSLNNMMFYTFAASSVIFMSIAAAIRLAFEDGYVWAVIVMSINAVLHSIGLSLIRKGFAHLRHMIFCLSVANILAYANFLATIGNQFSTLQLIFLEDIFVYVVIIFMRTHTFVWDASTIVVSRLILFILLLIRDPQESSFPDYLLLVILCIVSGILIVFNLFKNEKLRRVAFLNKKQREQWNLIVDEVLPINVIISKYDQITGEIGLNASNQAAQSNFKVFDDKSYNSFIQKIRLDSPSSKRTLRDFVLEKHHNIALDRQKRVDLNIKPLNVQSKQRLVSDIRSIGEYDSPILDDLDSKIDRNPSIKKLLTQRSIIRKNRSLVDLGQQNRFFEIMKGYYCEDWETNPASRCQYKISVFQFSMNEPLLLINVEDNSVQETIKLLKENKKQYRELFKDTLRFFQDRIVRLSTEIGQLAIPISQSNIYYDLKFSVMSIFTGIHNILDFVFEQNVKNPSGNGNTVQGQNLHSGASVGGANSLVQQGSGSAQKRELQPQQQKKKDSFFMQQISPEMSIEQDMYISIDINLNIKQRIQRQVPQQQQQPGSQSSGGGQGGPTMGNTKIRSFSLRKVLNEVSDVMMEKCRQKKLMFFFSDHMSDDYQMVQDQRRVKQVLFNYLQNALDNVNKGYIAVTVRPHTNLGLKTFRFDIMDSGPGLSDVVTGHQQEGGIGEKNTHIQVVSLRKKSTKQLRKVSSFSNYFQNITTANPASKKKGLGIGMKVNSKVIAQLGPYFPKVFSETDTGTHIVYELYGDIMAIRNLKNRQLQPFDKQQEDIPEEDECIGLSCYKYTRQEIYHFTKNQKTSNLLISPDSVLSNQQNGQQQQQMQGQTSSQHQLINPIGSATNIVPSFVQSMMNTPIIIPSNVSTIIADGNNLMNLSFPLRTPSSLLHYEPPSRYRPESMDNALNVKGRSNQFAQSNTQPAVGGNNNSFTLESFRSRDRSRNDSFFMDMNNRKRLMNHQLPNQLLLNLNGSDDGNPYSQNPQFQNGSLQNNNIVSNPAGHQKKYSLHDLSNYS